MDLTIYLPFPSEVEQAVIKYSLLSDVPYLERFDDLKFTVIDEDGAVIIDTVFNNTSFDGFGDYRQNFILREIVPE